ncbi:hypothetical protein Tco_1564265 [Tanacetum coccineum]
MTGDRSQLTNFVHKFLGTVKFGNDQIAKIIDANSAMKFKRKRKKKNKQFLIENDRLLDQIISQDIVNIVVNSSLDINTSVNVNSSVAMNDSVNYVEMCNKCLKLEAELIKQHNMVEKDEYNKLSKRFSKLEQHCISLELAMQLNKENFQKNNTSVNQTEPSFDQLFKLNNLKADSSKRHNNREEKVFVITAGNGYLRKGQKRSQNRQNRAWNGKEREKSKSQKSTKVNPDKVKVKAEAEN